MPFMPPSAPFSGPRRAGDAARRRAGFALLLCALALPLSIGLFATLERAWGRIAPLEGGGFMLAATALGAALAIAPLAAFAGFILAVWHGVESVYLPRSQRSPLADRCIVAAGLAVWFSPMLAALAMVTRAVASGRVHVVRAPQDYALASDPVAYWQGVGFWLVTAGMCGFFAWRYWRGKLRRRAG